MATTQIQEAPTAMIDRVSTVLDVFVGQRALTLAEVARRAGLPPSSTHRILRRLVELGWVERCGFEYVLGMRMFELGAHAKRQRGVHEAAAPVMSRLQRGTGFTVYLSSLIGAEVLHLDRAGLWPEPDSSWGIGARQRAEVAAPGLALLAALPAEELPEFTFESAPTCYSVRSRAQLERELQRVRERGGVAVDSQGCALGVTVVAASIDVLDDRGPVALSICGPTKTLRVDAAVAAVRNAAADIWYTASGAPRARSRGARPAAVAVGFR
ncbi:IclR family transcriptional regulator [Mycobacterium sp. BMJ-28]